MASFSILNNVSALSAQNQLCATSAQLDQTLQRLSSGKRINTGADDPAGLIFADVLKANIKALDQAVRNSNDCLSVGQIADEALEEITNLLTRSVTLAEQGATDTADSTGRVALDNEFAQIEAEIARIACQTNYDGVQLFSVNGMNGSLNVFVGDMFGSSSITVPIQTITADDINGTVSLLGTQDLTTIDLTTQAGCQSALSVVKQALVDVANERATIGGSMTRIQSAISVIQSQSISNSTAESQIRDANMAAEISNLTKFQILSQTGVAALSQANAQSSSILSLLKSIG
jgi:flagellin